MTSPFHKIVFAIGMLTLLSPAWTNAATIYMCRAYSGGSFWSSAHCRTHNALIERTASVPDGMPFAQQVQLGEEARAEGRRLLEPPPARPIAANTAQSTQIECAAIDARIRELDQLARQPQSGATQDRITEDRRLLRDRQFHMMCR